MKKLLTAILSVCSVSPAVNAAWFENTNTVTQVHQHLLNKDLNAMFQSLVEEWQLQPIPSLQSHINQLFLQSLEVDCGKSLTQQHFPEWIKSVVINQQYRESPGRDTYVTTVEVMSDSVIQEISLNKWIDGDISNDKEAFVNDISDAVTESTEYGIRYNLVAPLEIGLYQLNIYNEGGEHWSQWVILSEESLVQTVRWASKDEWRIEKHALVNSYCPLPMLRVGVYDYIDNEFVPVWTRNYESDYPTTIENKTIAPDRYVLSIAMTQSRWQGQILFERSQIISKTFDVSAED
ncbi:DUF2861 family protein [Vibrio hippocampi]|uniref:DUF2861 family protein n=1 Tax=Vibrio hippocampi TaxID=654686 RepID=A0ABN8DJV1_9VIBR|nr:DUF2861 family protein [Vibrio hippocampi]CAH0529624.1 hypothetical protein VHP8226_03379 [Vibrio hippocampi]